MSRPRIGVIGTGGIAHAHLAGYRKVLGDGIEIAAACDSRGEVVADFAEKWSIQHTFTDARELIRSGAVDVIVLLTPPAVREEVILPAIEAGIPVLVEKPFATDGPSAVRYTEASEEAGVPVAVSQNLRWFPEYQWASEWIASGRIGRVDYLDARSFQDRPQPAGVWRATEMKLEMAIFSVHILDRLQWLAPGIPQTVSAVTRRARHSSIPGEQFSTVTVQFDDGAVAQMTSSWRSKALPSNDLRIDGEAGSIAVHRREPVHGDAQGRAQGDGGEITLVEFPDSPVAAATSTFGHSLAEFLTSIAEGRPASHSARNNLRTMGVMEAAYLSAERGGTIVTAAEALGSDVLGPAPRSTGDRR